MMIMMDYDVSVAEVYDHVALAAELCEMGNYAE